MAKLIGIIGMPGTGKTTMMREWMAMREWSEDTPIKLLNTHVSSGIRLFGKYAEGDIYAGTDKLSMAVQPAAIEYLKGDPSPINVFEGDRLTTLTFFEEAVRLGHDVTIIELTVDNATREQRYRDRGSEQSDTFVNGRRTKVRNITNRFSGSPLDEDEPNIVETYNHETPEDTKVIIARLEQLVLAAVLSTTN